MRQPRLADRDQVAVRAHRFDEARSVPHLERRHAKIAPVADLSRGDRVHRLRRKIRQQLRGRDQGFAQAILASKRRQLLQSPGGFDLEIARGNPPQAPSKTLRTPAPAPPHARCCEDRSPPSSARAPPPRSRPCAERPASTPPPEPASDPPADACAPVRKPAGPPIFFAETAGGICSNSPRNRLSADSSAPRSSVTATSSRSRRAIRVIGIGGIAEVNDALVNFIVASVELRQPRGAADDQRQHAGGRRVQRAQVPHLARVRDAAHLVDHIVRGPLRRLVDYDHSIHGPSW